MTKPQRMPFEPGDVVRLIDGDGAHMEVSKTVVSPTELSVHAGWSVYHPNRLTIVRRCKPLRYTQRFPSHPHPLQFNG